MKEKYRFGYGRKQTIDKMKDTAIKLPKVCLKIAFHQTHSSKTNGILDFIYMESYMKSMNYSDRIQNEFRKNTLPNKLDLSGRIYLVTLLVDSFSGEPNPS